MFKTGFYLSVLAVFFGVWLSGCSVPGSTDMPVLDESVTLRGTVAVPTVANSGLLTAIGMTSDSTAFARFFASSTLEVNGRRVEFSLNESTRQLRVEKVSPASAYELALRCGDFSLYAFVPHQGLANNLPYGLSLRSTAEWYLRAAHASDQGISLYQFADYQVVATLIDKLTADFQTELAKPGLASAAWRLAAESCARELTDGRELTQLMQYSGNTADFTGSFAGTIYYQRLGATGEPALLVQAAAEMTCTRSGDQVSGSLSIRPLAARAFGNATPGPLPGETSFAFSGGMHDQLLSFTRIAANDGSPLSGKALDRWLVLPVSDGLAVRAENLDTAYFTGLQSRAGEFVLRKK
jgi:hypothetical protein